jgi:hypothetical protein
VHLDHDTLVDGLAVLERQVVEGDDAGAKATLLGLAVPAMGVPDRPAPAPFLAPATPQTGAPDEAPVAPVRQLRTG